VFPEGSGKAPLEMVKISAGRVVRAFNWSGFGWVCIALALGEECYNGCILLPLSMGAAGGQGDGWRLQNTNARDALHGNARKWTGHE
jgi:hypothetical protein